MLIFNFGFQMTNLFYERLQKVGEPDIPVGFCGLQRFLRGSECNVIGLFGSLDNAFKRAVGDVDVSGTQQQQKCQCTGQAAVAVLVSCSV